MEAQGRNKSNFEKMMEGLRESVDMTMTPTLEGTLENIKHLKGVINSDEAKAFMKEHDIDINKVRKDIMPQAEIFKKTVERGSKK